MTIEERMKDALKKYKSSKKNYILQAESSSKKRQRMIFRVKVVSIIIGTRLITALKV